jgi:hypothetical protein
MATEKLSVAETWQERIDRPLAKAPAGAWAVIDRRAVRRMKEAAVDVLQNASGRYTDIFVFADGTGIYEKRQDDWYVAEMEEFLCVSCSKTENECDCDEGFAAAAL